MTEDDAELLRRTAAGDGRAFESVVREHFAVIHAYALRALGDADRAQETVQETFVRAFKYCASYEPESGSVRAWLMGIAANKVKDARRARRRQPASFDAAAASTLEAAGEDALEALEREDRREEVRAALAELEPEHREVLELRYLGALSYEDVAAALGISVGAARLRAFRARDLLAGRLGRLVDGGSS